MRPEINSDCTAVVQAHWTANLGAYWRPYCEGQNDAFGCLSDLCATSLFSLASANATSQSLRRQNNANFAGYCHFRVTLTDASIVAFAAS